MKLTAPTREDVQIVREWRNAEPQFLRTPYLLTEEMQNGFYDNVICNRDSKHRYFSIYASDYYTYPIGFGGLTNIEWENGCAEISLIINPDYRGEGHGRSAVYTLLRQGFKNMRLETIYGEVYYCGNYKFWEKIVDDLEGYKTTLIGRKVYNGSIYGSIWFAFEKERWLE